MLSQKVKNITSLLLVILPIFAFGQLPVQKPKESEIDYYNRMGRFLDDNWHSEGNKTKDAAVLPIVQAMYKRWPNDTEAMSNYGFILERLGKGQEALKLYHDFNIKHKKLKGAAFWEAHWYFARNQYSKAADVLKHAKNDKQAYTELALAYKRIKDYENSYITWKYILKLYPNDAVAKRHVKELEDYFKKTNSQTFYRK